MLIHFLSFEVRYWLRSWMLWIFLLIIALLVFGATATDQVTIGQALENTYRNAPFVIENYYSILGLLTLLMTVAFVNSAASREFAYNTHQILFATPLKKFDYLAGRFLGSALIAVIPMLGVSVGIIVGKWMPWVDPERWGPVNWTAHLYGILVFAIPNTLFVSAIIFAIGAQYGRPTRNLGGAARSFRYPHIRARDEILDRRREKYAHYWIQRSPAVEPPDLARRGGGHLRVCLFAVPF